MKLLAIETSSTACSLALLLDNEIILTHQILPMQQTQHILSMLDELINTNKVTLNQLDAIAFGCGPGSFTGVRIATSVAQGLGLALQTPLIPISSLATFALTAHQEYGWNKILVAIDARMNEVYWAAFHIEKNEILFNTKEIISAPHHIDMKEPDFYGAGNAWGAYSKQIIYKPKQICDLEAGKASALAVLAKQKFITKQWISAADAMPIYLRDNVATKS